MADYSSLRVPELKKLLAERKLPQTGNKADLIARLQDEDKKKASPTAKVNSAARSGSDQKEDEITYSDDESSAAHVPKPTIEPKTAKDLPKEEADKSELPQPVSARSPKEPAEIGEEPKEEKNAGKPAQSKALGLAKSASDAEAQKRADRAKRFGIEEDEESKKCAERAKRFGIDDHELASGLDSALPERSLKRGRGRGGEDESRSRKRQSSDRRGDRRGDRHAQEGRASRPNRSSGRITRGSVLDDPIEKAKAEKRAARFAAA